ncbi:MAG TPA: GtrA family protein [Edaphocola sp.]|nr:GtrA family protein [Edaphocola sp.]
MSRISEHNAVLNFRNLILEVLDVFYPIFRRFIPLQTYRYLACGGSVTLLGLLVYFLSYNFLFPAGLLVHFGPFTLTRYIAAYVVSFCVSFPTGFFLAKFVVFSDSYLKGKIQLFRYGSLQFLNIFLNWALLHFFAGFLHFWATPSQALTGAILAVLSYFFQRYISFRGHKAITPAPEETLSVSGN